MRTCKSRLCLLSFIIFYSAVFAQSESQFNGHFNVAYWSLSQNTLDQDNALASDNVDDDFLQDNYRLLMLNLRLYSQKKQADRDGKNNFRFVARSRHNLSQTPYTLGYNQDIRYDISELSMEYQKLFSGHDFWLGRQIVFESGGMRFDGARFVFNFDQTKVGVFSGLGQDPRSALGFIGSSQSNQLLSSDFFSLGSYVQSNTDQLNFSTSLNSLIYKGEIDRLYSFTHLSYKPNSKTTFSGLLNYAFVPNSLDQLMLNFYYVFSDRFDNSLSFSRWSNIEYAASQSSQIPSQGQFTPDTYVNGDAFNDTFFSQIREQLNYTFSNTQNIFAGIEYTKRSFDDLDRYRYFFGYRNNALFDPSIDFQSQFNFVNNYRSTHVAFDLLIGKDFSDGQFRLESFFNRVKTERDIYLNNTLSTLPTENEQEFSYGGNAFWYFSKKNLLHARYQIFQEEDSLNDNDTITINDLYIGSSFKF